MKTRTTAAFSIAVLVALAGCGGHGKYTSEQMSVAQQRQIQFKSAQVYDMSRQSFLAGDLDKALKNIDRCLTMNPSVAKSHVLRGRILSERGDLEKAVEAFLQAEALEPKNVEAQYYLGIVYERFTQKDKALERYLKAAELGTTDPQYVIAAAEMMIDLGQLDEAEKYLGKQRSAYEHNAGVRQTLAHVAMIRGDGPKAVTLLEEAHLLAPDDDTLLEDLARAQIMVGSFAEAEFALAQLLNTEGNADRRDLKHMRARCLLNVDRPLDARDLLLELTKASAGGKDIDAWVELGRVACELNDQRNLQQSAQRVMALAPDQPDGYLLKGMLHKRRGELTQALAAFDKACQFRGRQSEPLVMRGLVLEEMGRTREARASYSQALLDDPSNTPLARLVAATGGEAAVAGVSESEQ